MSKLNVAQAKKLLELRKKSKPTFVLTEFLFKEQLDFVNDPAKYATAVTSVRAGKTTSCAADLISTALNLEGTIGLYITLTRASAKKIVWPELIKINHTYKLGAKVDKTELSFTFPNGSIIYCSGANTEVEIERFRGLSNVALVYIDESQAFRAHLKELVEDIIVKRLYDTNGRCRMIGTPGPIPTGYFYEASQSPMWSHHSWTLHQNPHIAKKSGMSVQELIQQDMDRKGVTIDDPSIQRECFGRWVLDSNSLLLNYNPELNHYDELPRAIKWNYVLGIDLGMDDADSLSVLGWTDNSTKVWLIEEIITAGQGVHELTEQVLNISQKYDFQRMRIDTGGLGKKIAEDLKMRKGLPVMAAEKQEKLSNYAFLNDALRRGDFMAKKTSKFAQDCNILERDRDKSTSEKIVVKGHSDAVDSTLYAFKDTPAYAYMAPPAPLKLGTPEWAKREEEAMVQHTYQEIRKEQDTINNNQTNWLVQDTNDTWTDLSKWKKN